MKLCNIINNLFFPRKCIFCEKLLPVDVSDDYCCACEENAAFKRERLCRLCGKPLDIPRGELCCSTCKNKKTYFVQNVTRYLYKENVRDAIIRTKFHKNNGWIACALGKQLAKTVKEEYYDIAFDCVTCVPISSKRERTRGFNQSELIAKEVAKEINVPFLKNTLVKINDNRQQSGLKASQRTANVRGVYKNGNDSVTDMTVLLIDDVYTTGATVNECSKMLKKAGATLVYCATVCATKRSGRYCVSRKALTKLKNG